MWSCDHITSVLLGIEQKSHFFQGVVLTEVQLFSTGTRYALKILDWHGKRVKNKIQKVLEDSSYVCRSYRGKIIGGLFDPPYPK